MLLQMRNRKPNTTLGVTCSGNVRALCMALLSVFNSPAIPHKLLLRLEGEMPLTDDFYLAQVLDYIRQTGAEITITVAQSNGVRAARDWLVENTTTKFLWMIDDDVIVSPDCLEMLCRSQSEEGKQVAALQGTKTDVNNRRGYDNFNTFVHPRSDLKPGVSANHHWEKLPKGIVERTQALVPTYEIQTIDTGNVLLDVEFLEKCSLRFERLPLSANSGGEDTLMAVQIYMSGGVVLLNPWAQAIHLEKPVIKFNEFAARAQMVYEAAVAMGAPLELLNQVRRQIMPWVWPKTSTGDIKDLPSLPEPSTP